MAIHLLPETTPSRLARLIDDYLNSCRVRGVSPKTEKQCRLSLTESFYRGALLKASATLLSWIVAHSTVSRLLCSTA